MLRHKSSKGSFLLSGVSTGAKVNAGTCPHGMSPGACPICSGMGGGGSTRMGERPQKAGEWSYHQCAMIGAMMRAREQRIEAHEKNLLNHAQQILQFQQNLEKMAQRMVEFVKQNSNNFILKSVTYTISNIVVGISNVITKSITTVLNVVSNIADKLSQIKQKLVDIQDKLNALFGEAKAFVEKKISELVSNVKSKFEGLFKIFKRNNTKDDDTKIDEDKKIFNLKTILHKITRRKKKDDTESQSGS